ncbi:MAG: hypothetical protein M0Z50_16185, partial [Planctomycetia bacterium]|nr:hypothetical protein [Planctomycetia bacterium]
AGSASTSRRQSSHEKETADKTQNTLIIQPDVAMRSTGFGWNIRCGAGFQSVRSSLRERLRKFDKGYRLPPGVTV